MDREALKRSKNLPHGELAVGSSRGGLGDLFRGLGGHGRGTVSHGHGLNTGTNTDVNQTGLDVGGDADNGLQSRGALTVGGVDGGPLGVSGIESSHAGDGGTTGSLENVTNADIVNDGGVDLVALLDGDEDGSQKVLTILFLGSSIEQRVLVSGHAVCMYVREVGVVVWEKRTLRPSRSNKRVFPVKGAPVCPMVPG